MMTRPLATLLPLAVLIGCNPVRPKPTVIIGAAANLTDVFEQIGPRFETETGIHPVFNFASTAQLARQIENSAPFDVIAAADAEHVAELERKGLIAPGTRAVYARGVLALWIPDATRIELNRIQELTSPAVRVIAIAKPDLAPYGQAAVDTLQHLGIWERVQTKIVYAENIGMAKQYGKSKNADAVFTAYSLVLHESGKVIRVDENRHQPLNQELGIVANSPHVNAARKFTAFLLSVTGKSILANYGYFVENTKVPTSTGK